MHGLEKDRTRRYQTMAAFERDLERLLAGDLGTVLEDAAPGGSGPVQVRSRWLWHLAVAAVFAAGLGTAALLARAGGKEPAAAPRTAPARRPTTVPAQRPLPPPEPETMAGPTQPSPPLERGHRAGKQRPAHPPSSAPAAASAPSVPLKKSKADDKVAPSPYTSP
jgi:hypothetical protein